MRKNLSIFHLLLPIGTIFLVVIFVFNQNPILIASIITLTFIYIAFSLMHHKLDKSLTFGVIAEYLLIAFLVLVILAGVTI